MNCRKRIMAFLLCVTAVLLASSSVFAEDGAADFVKIFKSYPKYNEAVRQLVAEKKQKDDELAAALEKTRKKAAQKKLIEENQAWYEQRRSELFAPSVNDAKAAIDAVAKEKNLGHIYNIRDGKPGIDITDAAIAKLNGTAPAPAPAPVVEAPQPVQQTEVQQAPAPQKAVKKNVKKKKAVKKTAKNAAVKPAAQPAAAKPAAAPKAAAQPAAAAPAAQPAEPLAKGSYCINFGADVEPGDITKFVAKAQQNGISTARVVESADAAGKKHWYARATAPDLQQARQISAKLRKIGLKNFVAKIK